MNYQSYFVVAHFVSFESTDIHTDERKHEKLINRDIWYFCACKQGKTISKKKKKKRFERFVHVRYVCINAAVLVNFLSLVPIGIVDLLLRGPQAG